MKFDTIQSQPVYQGRAFSVRKDQVRLPDGAETALDIVEHSGAVTILPIDSEGQVWFVRQYRHAAGIEILELPAGTFIEMNRTSIEREGATYTFRDDSADPGSDGRGRRAPPGRARGDGRRCAGHDRGCRRLPALHGCGDPGREGGAVTCLARGSPPEHRPAAHQQRRRRHQLRAVRVESADACV